MYVISLSTGQASPDRLHLVVPTCIADGHFLFSRSLVSSSSSDFPEHELAIGLLRNVLLHDKACLCVCFFSSIFSHRTNPTLKCSL